MSLPREFSGSARFALRKTLGSGGMGVVYHAYDRTKGYDVALKTLRFMEPEAIYRLKREFRSLADVSHPNLVSLYELVSEGEHWFIVMELVRGVGFLEHVRGTGGFAPNPSTLDIDAKTVWLQDPLDDDESTQAERRDPSTNTEVSVQLAISPATHELHQSAGSLSTARSGDVIALSGDTWPETKERPNVVRLRAALKQLVQGTIALHAAGKLHRDLKPSNVLVTPTGRVVILDFGLVAELFPQINASATEHGFSGTVPYMAPEQGSPEGRAAPADWYSVGVMLYEALAGRLPFPGVGIDVLLRKQREDPPRPSQFARNVPPDLELLAMQLLDRDPHRRPTGEELLARLGASSRRRPSNPAPPPRTQEGPFIGRQRHLDALESAFGATRSGHPVAVFVRGASGIGKTSLIKSFLDDLHQREGALVFAGRCYERESVPFKAVDGLVDAMSRHLARLSFQEASALLPRNIRAFARVFPVLLRVEAIERAPKLPAETPDFQELRRRAFQAAAELLANLAERQPVVLFIDDLQWGDADSAALLLDLLKPPDGPPILFIASYRSDEEASSPFLRDTLHRSRAEGADARVLTLGALEADEARDLALTLLAARGNADEKRARQIAAEADGNPFFIEALVRHERKIVDQSTPAEPVSLDRVMQVRLARLGRGAKAMLEVVATAGRPLPVEIAASAADVAPEETTSVLASLKTSGFIRTTPSAGGEQIETFHDRVRVSVTSQMSPEAIRERHRAIAEAVEREFLADRTGPGAAEAIFHHYRAAQEPLAAARHAVVAAEEAAAALAFDRAAQLYTFALEHLPPKVDRQLTLARLGDALANAGRGAQAADAYLSAAQGREDLAALDLRRMAAEQLLVTGHVDRGLEELKSVLAQQGLKLAKTPRRAYLSRILRRGALWRRGFQFTERKIEDLPPEDLMRIDVLWTAVVGLVLIDFIRGADFQSRHVMLALEAGEPYRIVRALALEACYVATGGGPDQSRTARLVEEASTLARRVDLPHALGLASFAEGAAAYFEGHWARARLLLERAEELFRDRCRGVHWEIMATRMLLHGALYQLGHVAVLSKRIALLVDEAALRGDLFAGTVYRVGHSTSMWLAADNPERAMRNLDEAMAQWSNQGFYVQHALALLARVRVLLYAARPLDAHEAMEKAWATLDDNYFLELQYMRVEAYFARALAAVAVAHQSPKRKTVLLQLAHRCAGEIAGENMRWTAPIASLLFGSFAEHKGEVAEAHRHYRAAIAGFEASGMTMLMAAAELRLGELIGGAEGKELVTRAFEKMHAQNVKNPIRFSLCLAPISSKY